MSILYRCRLETLDYLFFATHEGGAIAAVEPYIHSSALLYALNSDVEETQRLADGLKPHYEEDRARFMRWVTPAAPWGPATPVRMSYNAVDETLRFSMERGDKLVVPAFGVYSRFPPLTRWKFFMIADAPPPRLVRVGKKRAAARLTVEPAHAARRWEGRFVPSHPVALADLPSGAAVSIQAIRLMLPSPLAVGLEMEGVHMRADFRGGTENIALPDMRRYPRVAWPTQ
jgi:CRISPR type I-D-associated protein Csc1